MISKCYKCDDGSIVFEIYERNGVSDFTIGFTIEKNIADSGWYYVTKNELAGDPFPEEFIEMMREALCQSTTTTVPGA